MSYTPSPSVINQIPLILEVYEDEHLLLSSPDTEWYRKLKNLPWRDYCETAAQYYDALHHFNKSRRESAGSSESGNNEDKEAAKQRLLFDRPTMDKTVPVLYEPEFQKPPVRRFSPLSVAPGIVPHREGGPKPKCFFAMFTAFLGVMFTGFEPDPENVRFFLTSNPAFAGVCGFIPPGEDEEYWYRHIPGLRKIQQFDQIMTDYGLWNREKLREVRKNIEQKIIEEENKIVGDTTHYYAYSGFETVVYTDENDKEQKKSQSRLTKNCRCEDRDTCSHPWELSDDGAGTVVKAARKMIWGHKASVVGLPLQGIPLDARCVGDAATHDSQTFYPHINALFEDFPELSPWFCTALYDSACDDPKLKQMFEDDFGIRLKTSLNPRRRKTVTENLPKFMDKLTPYGTLTCTAGYDMNFKGVRHDTGKFIYQAPVGDNNESVCSGCEHRTECTPLSSEGRTVTIPFSLASPY
ncbi:MAG: hypothetical protein V2I97_12980 [Desulfococcaceae bacterium]|nr:hypothetical protein [Desulfococcaceae bacterium]